MPKVSHLSHDCHMYIILFMFGLLFSYYGFLLYLNESNVHFLFLCYPQVESGMG